MGYSCSAIANMSLDALMDNVSHVNNSSNVWQLENKKYMYEIGRENSDGAITGTIYYFLTESDRIIKAGSFKIESDGRIARFKGTNKYQRKSAEMCAAAKYIKMDGFPRKESISEKHPAYTMLCQSPFVCV